MDTVSIQRSLNFLTSSSDCTFSVLLRRIRKLYICFLGYRTMLATVFYFILPEFSVSPIFLDLMRSFMVEFHVWSVCHLTCDLDLILCYLISSPIELLSSLSLRSLPKKVEILGFIGHYIQGKRVAGFIYSCLFLSF